MRGERQLNDWIGSLGEGEGQESIGSVVE